VRIKLFTCVDTAVDCLWWGVKHCRPHKDYECMHCVVFCCV